MATKRRASSVGEVQSEQMRQMLQQQQQQHPFHPGGPNAMSHIPRSTSSHRLGASSSHIPVRASSRSSSPSAHAPGLIRSSSSSSSDRQSNLGGGVFSNYASVVNIEAPSLCDEIPSLPDRIAARIRELENIEALYRTRGFDSIREEMEMLSEKKNEVDTDRAFLSQRNAELGAKIVGLHTDMVTLELNLKNITAERDALKKVSMRNSQTLMNRKTAARQSRRAKR